jgi:hypothetical protein
MDVTKKWAARKFHYRGRGQVVPWKKMKNATQSSVQDDTAVFRRTTLKKKSKRETAGFKGTVSREFLICFLVLKTKSVLF